MQPITLIVTDEGIKTIGDLPRPLRRIGIVRKFRESRVEPVRPGMRRLFHALRRYLGPVGTWLSRRLPGPWQATILSTGREFMALRRSQCIQWEIEELKRMMAGQ